MALPKRKHSHARTRKRRSSQKVCMPSLTKCPSCGALIRTYTVCPQCGSYRGRKILEIERKKKEKKA